MARKKRSRTKFGFLRFSYIRGANFLSKDPSPTKLMLRVNRTCRLMPHLSSTVFNGKMMHDSCFQAMMRGIYHSTMPKFKNVTLQFNKD